MSKCSGHSTASDIRGEAAQRDVARARRCRGRCLRCLRVDDDEIVRVEVRASGVHVAERTGLDLGRAREPRERAAERQPASSG